MNNLHKYLAQWYHGPESLEPAECTFNTKEEFLKFSEKHDLLFIPSNEQEWEEIDESYDIEENETD